MSLFSLVLDHLQGEVIQLDLFGPQLLCVLQEAAVKICTNRNLPDRPEIRNTDSTASPPSEYHDLYSAKVLRLRTGSAG